MKRLLSRMGESGRIMIGLSLLAAALCAGSLWFLGVERARAACNVEGIGEVTIDITPKHLYVCKGGTATGEVSVSGVYSSVSIPVTFETNRDGDGDVIVSPSSLILPRSPSSGSFTVEGTSASTNLWDTEVVATIRDVNGNLCPATQKVTVVKVEIMKLCCLPPDIGASACSPIAPHPLPTKSMRKSRPRRRPTI